MMAVAQNHAPSKPPKSPANWQDTDFARLVELAQQGPFWTKLTENQRQLRQAELQKMQPAQRAALLEALKFQIAYWRKHARKEAALLDLLGMRAKAQFLELERIAGSVPVPAKYARINRPRNQWNCHMLMEHQNWLADWQSAESLREALCYSKQQFWKLTRKLPASQKRRKGRNLYCSFAAVLSILRTALKGVSVERRITLADCLWLIVRQGHGKRVGKMRDLLVGMGAECPSTLTPTR